ncbi:MAG: chloride channel protein [Bacteroidales bacterium]|nr:chloride channel protein [Bacteroidales bacterium]
MSGLIGVFGATAAVVIKNLLYLTSIAVTKIFAYTSVKYLYLIFPPIGILLTLLFVKKVVRDDLSHGVSIVLKAICKSDGKLRFHNVYSSMVASSITVGFGGSVGLEAPIVLTGSAIGSNVARFFKMNSKHTNLLLACGSTAAMAAIFKAPIAALVFTFEVLMLDLTGSAILPLLVSAITGTVFSLLFWGKTVMFTFDPAQTFLMGNIPIYITLGLLTGLVSVFYLRASRWVEKQMKRVTNIYARALIGSGLLCAFIFIFPSFFGEGYNSVNEILNGDMTHLFANSPLNGFFSKPHMLLLGIAGIFMLKVFATTLTNSAGGVGGVFAPSLFIGAFVGLFVALVAQHFFSWNIPTANFVLAGMAGVMTGIMQAPLTAIFLIAELSGGYTLLIPLMITATCAYISTYPFEKYSVYTYHLAEKDNLKTHNKNKYALRKLQWNKIIDTNILTIPIHSTLRTYTELIAASKRNLFVVTDEFNHFEGLLVMDDHRPIIFDRTQYDTLLVENLMIDPGEFIYDDDTAAEVLEKFNRTGNFNMPIITRERKYIGFVSKAKFLAEYQSFIAADSED